MPVKHFEMLKTILARPSAPFREKHVIDEITAELTRAKVPHFIDPVGNIVVGVGSKKEYLRLVGAKSQEPVRVFIAHTDHPGFHGEKWIAEDRFEFKWHGGSPTQYLPGSKVWIARADGFVADATMESAELTPTGRSISHGVIRIHTPMPQKQNGKRKGKQNENDAKKIYGGFHFRDFVWQEGDLIYSKAADDLVGSFAITALAIDLFKKKKSKTPPFIGLLTRAEEVGFIGAIGHFELGWLKKAKRPILGVSLETSRALPGAEIGKGPVVRLGDKFTVFDSGALRVFTELAVKVLPDKHQRRVMDGGTCEATAATVYGIPCVGISVPLGNYHNQSFEGGPDSRGDLGPAPEFVSLEDIAGLQTLCEALLRPGLAWKNPWVSRLKDFKKSLKGYQLLLKTGP
jgi:putative aminopeptidase FrvX